MVDEMSRRLSFAIVCSVHKPFSQSLCFHVSVQECEGIWELQIRGCVKNFDVFGCDVQTVIYGHYSATVLFILSFLLQCLTVPRSLRTRLTRCQASWFIVIFYHCLTVSRTLRARWTRCQGDWFTIIFYHCSVRQCHRARDLGGQDAIDSQSYSTLFDSVKELESKVDKMSSRLIHNHILPLF